MFTNRNSIRVRYDIDVSMSVVTAERLVYLRYKNSDNVGNVDRQFFGLLTSRDVYYSRVGSAA